MHKKIIIKTQEQRRIEQLEEENKFLKLMIETLSAQSDFHEELMIELATVVYEP